MPIFSDFSQRLAAAWPAELRQNQRVLLGVSGGADSVALLRSAAELHAAEEIGALVVGHVNHRLRPDADADQRFVENLAERLGCVCETAVVAPREKQHDAGDGLEAAARAARYAVFERIAREREATVVAVAHTADDQAETILHHFLRGTGLAGLAGIPASRPLGSATLFRPLLNFRRRELLDYLQQLGQPYREDVTNRDLGFTRNRLRHDLLPRLAEYNPSVSEALMRVGQLAGEAHAVLSRLAAAEAEKRVSNEGGAVEGNVVAVDTAGLHALEPYLIREMFVAIWKSQQWPRQAMTFAHWQLLADMLLAGQGKQTFPGRIEVEARPQRMLLTPPSQIA